MRISVAVSTSVAPLAGATRTTLGRTGSAGPETGADLWVVESPVTGEIHRLLGSAIRQHRHGNAPEDQHGPEREPPWQRLPCFKDGT